MAGGRPRGGPATVGGCGAQVPAGQSGTHRGPDPPRAGLAPWRAAVCNWSSNCWIAAVRAAGRLQGQPAAPGGSAAGQRAGRGPAQSPGRDPNRQQNLPDALRRALGDAATASRQPTALDFPLGERDGRGLSAPTPNSTNCCNWPPASSPAADPPARQPGADPGLARRLLPLHLADRDPLA